jgi:hypothetical protein
MRNLIGLNVQIPDPHIVGVFLEKLSHDQFFLHPFDFREGLLNNALFKVDTA